MGPTDSGQDSSRPRAFRGGTGQATAALIGLRVAYAYNWFDIGPGLPAIGRSFGLGTSDWGLLIAAFLAGAGAAQVPAGMLARAWGTRRVSMLGAALLGGAALASSAAPDFLSLLAARAACGVGAGLFFSPAISLVSSLHPEGSRGVPVGTFSSAFSAGAGLGVFASALLVPAVGWRLSLAIGGVLVLALLVIGELAIPSWAGAPPAIRRHERTRLPPALRSLPVWGIGLAFAGLEGASVSAGQYFVPYAQIVRGWSPAIAGAVGALFVFPSLFGGPLGGRMAERFTNRRTQLAVFTAAPALLLLLVPAVGLAEVAVIGVTFSVSYGMVYAMMYILPPYLPGLSSDDTPLAIGLLNGIQLAGGSVVAFSVGWIAGQYGYVLAWEALGLSTLATLVFLCLVPRTGPGPERPIGSEGAIGRVLPEPVKEK